MLQNRRDFLRGTLGAATCLAIPRLGRSEAGQTLTVVPLGRELIAIAGGVGNVVAAATRDGVLMVDGGPAQHSAALLDLVARELSQQPVRTLFNTHWHPEHTGCNEPLGSAGARIVAHENTRQWLGARITVRWQNRTYEPLPDVALPTETFYERGELELGDERVEYAHLLQAHTDGDIYVRFRNANVLATGGVVSAQGWPLIDWWTGGWFGGMLDGLEKLLELADDETRIVPGRGPVLTRADLAEQYAMFSTIFERLHDMLIKSYSIEEAVAARPTREFEERWGNGDQFVELAFRSFWGHLRTSPRIRLMP